MYAGPHLPEWEGIDSSWVPIVPVTSRWDDKTGKSLTRTQLPLTPAWAITIHKSQGLTLHRAVIDLGQKDCSSGLSFVAISRVKKLAGAAFRTSFGLSRLQRPNVTESMKMLEEDTQRRNQLGFTLDTYGMDLSQYVFSD
ncbi:hypothetical protein DFH09DRAFT_920980 [Mycena vulgaris]|nr:hypothetical protein DFH09DRAFT_920980 [Mycena vulgaris]